VRWHRRLWSKLEWHLYRLRIFLGFLTEQEKTAAIHYFWLYNNWSITLKECYRLFRLFLRHDLDEAAAFRVIERYGYGGPYISKPSVWPPHNYGTLWWKDREHGAPDPTLRKNEVRTPNDPQSKSN